MLYKTQGKMYGNTVHVLVLPLLWTMTYGLTLAKCLGPWDRSARPRTHTPVYAVLVEKAGHFRKKLGIFDSINTGLAK
jgi:hypothetical protein